MTEKLDTLQVVTGGGGRVPLEELKGLKMDRRKNPLIVGDSPGGLARDVSRFKTLYPNGEAKLKETPTETFQFLNSAEMVIAVNH